MVFSQKKFGGFSSPLVFLAGSAPVNKKSTKQTQKSKFLNFDREKTLEFS
jgi:hypothetical protein